MNERNPEPATAHFATSMPYVIRNDMMSRVLKPAT
jgi:hypothetical protein